MYARILLRTQLFLDTLYRVFKENCLFFSTHCISSPVIAVRDLNNCRCDTSAVNSYWMAPFWWPMANHCCLGKKIIARKKLNFCGTPGSILQRNNICFLQKELYILVGVILAKILNDSFRSVTYKGSYRTIFLYFYLPTFLFRLQKEKRAANIFNAAKKNQMAMRAWRYGPRVWTIFWVRICGREGGNGPCINNCLVISDILLTDG